MIYLGEADQLFQINYDYDLKRWVVSVNTGIKVYLKSFQESVEAMDSLESLKKGLARLTNGEVEEVLRKWAKVIRSVEDG